MWHSRPPGDPPPLHGKCHLKFPFWFSAPFPYPLLLQNDNGYSWTMDQIINLELIAIWYINHSFGQVRSFKLSTYMKTEFAFLLITSVLTYIKMFLDQPHATWFSLYFYCWNALFFNKLISLIQRFATPVELCQSLCRPLLLKDD